MNFEAFRALSVVCVQAQNESTQAKLSAWKASTYTTYPFTNTTHLLSHQWRKRAQNSYRAYHHHCMDSWGKILSKNRCATYMVIVDIDGSTNSEFRSSADRPLIGKKMINLVKLTGRILTSPHRVCWIVSAYNDRKGTDCPKILQQRAKVKGQCFR